MPGGPPPLPQRPPLPSRPSTDGSLPPTATPRGAGRRPTLSRKSSLAVSPRPSPRPSPSPRPTPKPVEEEKIEAPVLPERQEKEEEEKRRLDVKMRDRDVFVPPKEVREAEDGWSERFTMDGAPYYYNTKTEAVSWNCPDSLKDASEVASEGAGKWRWVRDDEEAWVPAREVDGLFMTEDGRRVEPNPKDPVWNVMLSSLRQVEDDLVMIDDMNEGLIIHNIRERFKTDQIYTAIGTILISVNPFKRLPLYMPSIMELYYKSGGNKKLPPHPFGIADYSYKKMREFRKNQSILISGESGAGKTEATKQCLSFLAEVAGSSSRVEEKIIEANPILEAFGNAKTGRNNNSSRFGKFMEIHFDKSGHIVGARTENYLLEKSRVTFQTEGERNYHIFYMLCVGSHCSTLGLSPDMNTYRYLNSSGCLEVLGIDDTKEFADMMDAFNCLGFSDEEQMWILNTTAAVLLLGNLTFKAGNNDCAVIENPEVITQIAKLLGVKDEPFIESIISRWFVIRGQDPTKIPFKPDEASSAADACAKAVYGKLFDWIVRRVNKAMTIPQETDSFIGVLDIFGFEIFETNSFEQLCINFANEKLQQHFNEYTFKLEESVYQSEEIKFFHIDFIDNQPILDMIEKKPKGLLVQLDEEIVMPKGTDETWFNKVQQTFSKTEHFVRVVKKRGHFIVKHYAGTVPYDSDGFLDKNRDSLWADITEALRGSSLESTADLFAAAPGEKKGRNPTLGGQFRGQLNNLMEKLRSTEPSYIRCVKPNSQKLPELFDSVMSLQQLTYAGVFEAIKIRQQGYPFRLTFTEFLRRYKCLAMKEGGWVTLKSKEQKGQIQEILELTKQDFSDIQMGRTMALYRAPQQRILELLRNLALERVCLVVQCWLRGCFARRFRAKLLKARPSLLSAISTSTSLSEASEAIEFAETTVGSYNRIFPFKSKEWLECQELRRTLMERERVTGLCKEALGRDPEEGFEELERAVVAGLAIVEYPGTEDQLKVFADTKDLFELTVKRRNCRAELTRATDFADKESLEAAIALASELGIPDTAEIPAAKAMVERCLVEEGICKELEVAQAEGGVTAYTETAQENINTENVQNMSKKAQEFGMRTKKGKFLETLCGFLYNLRVELKKAADWGGIGAWEAVEGLLGGMTEEDDGEGGSLGGHEEVSWAMDEVMLRERKREVHEPLKAGMEELNEETMINFLQFMEQKPFTPTGKGDQIQRMESIESEIQTITKEKHEVVVNCRKQLEEAAKTQDEPSLISAIDTATALPVNNTTAIAQLNVFCKCKLILAMKFNVDFGQRVEAGLILDEELGRAEEMKVKSLTSGEEISVTKKQIHDEIVSRTSALQKALDDAANIAPVTPRPQEGQEEEAESQVGEGSVLGGRGGVSLGRLVSQGMALLGLRQALEKKDWGAVEEHVGRVVTAQMQGAETNLAKSEMEGRAVAAECLAAITEAVGEVPNTHTDDTNHPSEGILVARLGQVEKLELKEDLEQVQSGRKMLAHLKESETLLTESMKFNVDYGRRKEVGLILDDELADSEAAEILSASSGAEISVTKAEIVTELTARCASLDSALAHASEISLVTRFVNQGRALIELRRCLLERNWSILDEKLGNSLSWQVDGPETNLAKDEQAGRSTAADCLEALKKAVEDVKNESDDFGHPSEGVLDSRLAQAERLEMKDLEEVVQGRTILEKIREAQKELGESMKFSIDWGKRLEPGMIFDDAQSGCVSAHVTSGSGGEIEVQKAPLLQEMEEKIAHLEKALGLAQAISLVTRLVKQGMALIDLRKCLLAREYPSLEEKISACVAIQAEGAETNMGKDEILGRAKTRDCLEGLRVAVEEVKNKSEDFGHPSEGLLEVRLTEAEKLELLDLPEVVAGKEMLERIRNTRKELQIGLTVTQYADFINLAEEFAELYRLFEESTNQLKKGLDLAAHFSYDTKETRDANELLQEVTILWYFQEDLHTGGYYEGAEPTKAPQDTVVLEPITSHYTDYNGFPYITEVGQYIVKKVYFLINLRRTINEICDSPEAINTIVPQVETELGCPTTPEVVSGKKFMEQLALTRESACPEAENLVREDLLIKAIKMCDDLFFNNADVERVRKLKDLVIELNEESRRALWVLDKERMKNVIARANEIRLTTNHFEYIQQLLDLGPMDWLKYEIKKAKELGDEDRKIKLSIEMKDLTLDSFQHMFGLSSLRNMRSPENYASQKLITLDRKKLAQGMLSFSKTPAHTSLIDFAQLVPETEVNAHKIVQALTKDSTRTFKNIMGYMQDKKYPYPSTLVVETIQMCLDQPMLRSEVYLQTIKQITNHPIPANKKKGYELLAIWCWQFPPQPDLDNILETYLRTLNEKPVSYLGRLRDVMYGGCKRTAPSEAEIEAFIKDFFFSVPKRSRYEEEVKPIADSPYTPEFFDFESPKKLFQLDEEDARLRV